MALIIAIGIRLVLFYYFKKQQAAGSEDSLISGETRKDVADRLEYRVISQQAFAMHSKIWIKRSKIRFRQIRPPIGFY